MSFNPNIPMGTDPMLQSQGQIKANFQAINAVFNENHVSLNSTEPLNGQHDLLLFREQTGNPTTTSSQIALYTKNVGGIPALFFRPNSNQTPIQMSYPSISTGLQSSNPNVYLPRQYSFVAGPFVVYGGLLSAVTNGSTITLTPTTTLIYAGLTIVTGTGNVKLGSYAAPVISGSGFTVQYPSSVNMPNIYYLAIGV